MKWPVDCTVHPDSAFLEMVQQTIAVMLVAQENHRKSIFQLSRKIDLWNISTEELWCRDAALLFVVNNEEESCIQFHGLGKNQIHKHDSRISEQVANRLGLPLLPTGLFGESVGVEQNGRGLLIAHESSRVNDNRNPGLSKSEIESRLLTAYGAKDMIWTEGVWGEDITDYHIGSLARFTGAGSILINLPDQV